MFTVTRDGMMQSVHATQYEAGAALHRHQSASIDHAQKYEGWKIEPFNGSEYERTALQFLIDTQTQFRVKFVRFGKYFPEDKEERDVYHFTLTRGTRNYSSDFGQSINNSGFLITGNAERRVTDAEQVNAIRALHPLNTAKLMGNRFELNRELERVGLYKLNGSEQIQFFTPPSAYDVLACLTKYDPETFENFCGEFGYDTDSKTAEKTYNAVRNEWLGVQSLWTDAESERLQDIS